MTAATGAGSWTEANQRYLVAALARLASCLEPQAEGSCPTDEDARIAQAMQPPPALEVLADAFRLSAFERDIVLLCAGVELDSKFAARCAAAQGDARRPHATFSMALASLPGAHWSAVSPAGPLRHWRLVHCDESAGITTSPLRIDERVLHFIAGLPCLEESLQHILQPVLAEDPLPPSQEQALASILRLCQDTSGEPPVVHLGGNDPLGKRCVAALAARRMGQQLFAIRAAEIPAGGRDRDLLLRIWNRETALSCAALLIESGGEPSLEPAAAFAERAAGCVFYSGPDPLRPASRGTLRVEVNKPAAVEQYEIWRRHLNGAGDGVEVERVVSQFDLSAGQIRAAAAAAGGEPSRLWEVCRAQSRPRLEDLAERIRPTASWDSIVLPETQRGTLLEISAQVRRRATVYDDWGFAAQCARGLGITALFAGPSGAGKTMAAEVLAAELRLDLYRIDLSAVISKYIGETEKNLRRVFDAAEEGGAILLFDEADALFGKRSEVKDSHDRYANIEVSYLLQRTESFRGLAILTTNLKDALDKAFLRRIRFVVEFPFPDASQRAEIWRRVFPAGVPLGRLDVERLAGMSIAGGNIRNIAMSAAFLAAEEESVVEMRHLARAARAEYAKLQKPATEVPVL